MWQLLVMRGCASCRPGSGRCRLICYRWTVTCPPPPHLCHTPAALNWLAWLLRFRVLRLALSCPTCRRRIDVSFGGSLLPLAHNHIQVRISVRVHVHM